MSLLQRLSRSPASRTAAASYAAFASTAIWGLVTIPVAVAYLEPVELGLWTVVNVFIGYLVWMDLGIGPATGRLMAPAVAAGDQVEINRWWTATRLVLVLQGITIIAIGLAFTPLIFKLLNIPDNLTNDGYWLLIGGILITGLSLPMRGAPGLLTAQNRFYWVPCIQIVTPWINLIVFFTLLRLGYGLKAYIWAMAVSQAITWISYAAVIRIGPGHPRIDFKGIERARFGKLFKLSLNMSVSGFSDTVLQSLPAILIARLGGLTVVPIYNFSWKGPMNASSLVYRTYQSFYPSLQRAYVGGRHDEFLHKHHLAGMLTLGGGLFAAGIVLAMNNLIVNALAGSGYFAGQNVNTAFALAMITIPLSGLFRILLPISGNLGKVALVSFMQIVVFIGFTAILWQPYGLAGVAFAFAFTPLLKGAYGYFRGTANCGYKTHSVSGNVAIATLLSAALVIFCGAITSQMEWVGAHTLTIPGREINIAPIKTLLVAFVPSMIGSVVLLRTAKSILHSIK